MKKTLLLIFAALGISTLVSADTVRLYPYPSDYTGDPAEGAMKWDLQECDYGYALTYIGRCHWEDHPHTNDSGEVFHHWSYGYDTPTGHYTVPNAVSGYVGTNYYTLAVKGLGNGGHVFTNLESVTISEGIEEVCGAFNGITNLVHVGLPSTLKRITTRYVNAGSFGNCWSLQSVTFPTNLQVIANSSFAGSGLVSVVLPDSVTNVENRAFCGCADLVSATLPNGKIVLGDDAFKDCGKLLVVGYGGCRDIPSRCFYGCSALSSFHGLCAITNIESSAFYACSSLTNFPYADGLLEIGDNTFNGCTAFTSIDLPDGVRKIGAYAFRGCSNVGRIRLPYSLTDFQSTSFYQLTPGELLTAHYTSLMTKSSVTNLTILPGMTSYAPANTYRGGQYTRVELPESVASIGRLAFQNNANLKELVTHGKIESIDEKAFAGCSSLTSLPECCSSVTNWGTEVFSGCTGLSKVVVPSSMKDIPSKMFYNCGGIQELIIEEGVESTKSDSFLYDYNIRSLNLPSTLTNIANIFTSTAPLVSEVVTCHQATPPVYLAKAFLKDFSGTLYYPPDHREAWEAYLSEKSLSSYGKSWDEATESDPGEVEVKGVSVPYGWLAKYGLTTSQTPEQAAAAKTGKKDCESNDLFVWQDYVAGTDLTDVDDKFTASITMVEGVPVISYTPKLTTEQKTLRVYKTFGKKQLKDEWTNLTDADSETMKEYNFFKVTVEMK